MDVLQTVPVFLALQFNEADGDGEGQETSDKENKEILVGGFIVEGDGEHAVPDGQETDAHHHDLREFHQKQVVFVVGLVGADHRDGAGVGSTTGDDAACHRGSGRIGGGCWSDGDGLSPWRCHRNQRENTGTGT